MAGPKKKEKLTKPGINYEIQKTLTKIRNLQTKGWAPTKSILKKLKEIATSPIYKERGGYEKTLRYAERHRKEAEKTIAERNKQLKKQRFEAIKKQKQKKKD